MFDIGSGEMLVILVLALLLFGGSLPDVARNLGRTVGDLKRGFSEGTRPLQDIKDGVEREVAEIGEIDDGKPKTGMPGDRRGIDPPAVN